MTAALSPELAIAYVRELSADVRAAVVLAADGTRLAGEPALAVPAAAAAQALGGATGAIHATPAGFVVAARSATHALLVVSSPLGLQGTTALDARAAVAALSGAPETPDDDGGAPTAAFVAAAEAALAAAPGP